MFFQVRVKAPRLLYTSRRRRYSQQRSICEGCAKIFAHSNSHPISRSWGTDRKKIWCQSQDGKVLYVCAFVSACVCILCLVSFLCGLHWTHTNPYTPYAQFFYHYDILFLRLLLGREQKGTQRSRCSNWSRRPAPRRRITMSSAWPSFIPEMVPLFGLALQAPSVRLPKTHKMASKATAPPYTSASPLACR